MSDHHDVRTFEVILINTPLFSIYYTMGEHDIDYIANETFSLSNTRYDKHHRPHVVDIQHAPLGTSCNEHAHVLSCSGLLMFTLIAIIMLYLWLTIVTESLDVTFPYISDLGGLNNDVSSSVFLLAMVVAAIAYILTAIGVHDRVQELMYLQRLTASAFLSCRGFKRLIPGSFNVQDVVFSRDDCRQMIHIVTTYDTVSSWNHIAMYLTYISGAGLLVLGAVPNSLGVFVHDAGATAAFVCSLVYFLIVDLLIERAKSNTRAINTAVQRLGTFAHPISMPIPMAHDLLKIRAKYSLSPLDVHACHDAFKYNDRCTRISKTFRYCWVRNLLTVLGPISFALFGILKFLDYPTEAAAIEWVLVLVLVSYLATFSTVLRKTAFQFHSINYDGYTA